MNKPSPLQRVSGWLGPMYNINNWPRGLIRLLVRIALRGRYRIDGIDLYNLPTQGPVVLLGNQVSWIDWAILQIASPRPIRFVLPHDPDGWRYVRWSYDAFGVVSVALDQDESAVGRISAWLQAGEMVCIFPEETLSSHGPLGQLQRAYEQAVVDLEQGVIVPFYLHGLRDSLFSRTPGKRLAGARRGFRRTVTIAFGKRLPLHTSPELVQYRVRELAARAWHRAAQQLEPLPLAWCRTAKARGNALCVTDTSDTSLSCHRALTAVIGFAGLMAKRSPEQNLGLLLPTSTGGAIANMAAFWKGKTTINLNYTGSPSALRAAIRKAEIRTVYTSRLFLRRLAQRGIELDDVLGEVQVFYLEDLKAKLGFATQLATLLMVKGLPARVLFDFSGRRVSIDEPAAILFSSGSEGEPKGAVLTHKNLMSNVKQVAEGLDIQTSDVVMGSLPLFHAFGLTATTLLPLIEGLLLVCHPDPTDSLSVAKAVAKYRGTVLCGTSTFFRLYTKQRRIHPLMLESLRLIIAGAEKLNSDVREAFQARFNKTIYEGYGTTETAPVTSTNVPDRLEPDHWRLQTGNKVGSVGVPLPGCSVRIVDPETLEELPLGQEGLILIGGPQVMAGYLKAPEQTAEVLVERDGILWYKTGDKGQLDTDGFLTIVDRYSRFAKVGGEMVSLGAVEEHARQNLNNGDVDLVAVNVPDERKGEKVILMVAGVTDIGALRKQLQAARHNPLMIPSEVHTIPEVPKLGSGKVDFKAAKTLARSLPPTD